MNSATFSTLRTIRHLHINIASEKFIEHLFEAFLSRGGHFRSGYPPDVIILLICRALKICAHQTPPLESSPDEFRHRVTRSFQTRGFLTHFTHSQFASSQKAEAVI
jgi:hypothetical protein